MRSGAFFILCVVCGRRRRPGNCACGVFCRLEHGALGRAALSVAAALCVARWGSWRGEDLLEELVMLGPLAEPLSSLWPVVVPGRRRL